MNLRNDNLMTWTNAQLLTALLEDIQANPDSYRANAEQTAQQVKFLKERVALELQDELGQG